MGQGAGHSGRARPRLGRRLAGRLCAHHHRPRSDPLRPAVRALPQSRARVDARLRHRLLPGPARRGDPLRPGALRPRPGGADHHLRHAAGARRAARRRPRPADALRPGRQAVQAGAAESGQPDHAQARHRGRAAPAGGARQRSGGQARLRHRPEARRPAPPRLDPRGRHRHRRAAARRDGAALSRSEIADAGDPVQHEMGRAGRAGEVRLPRAQDPDRAADRGQAGAQARHRDRSPAHPARRSQDLRDAGARRDRRHLPGGKPGHAPRAGRHAARPFRGHHRAGRALPAGPDGEHPDLLRPQARPGADRISPSEARADPARRPTASSPIRSRCSRSRRILAGYSLGEADLLRRAMGKKIKQGDGRAARRFPLRRGRARHRTRAVARHDLRRLRQVRRIRLQQVALGALCAAHLPDRLHEGELSGRVPGRLDDARHEQHRQARRIPRRGAAARHQGRGALGQPLGRRLRRRGQHHPLRARGAQRRRRAGGRGDRGGARRAPLHRPRRFRRPGQSARRQQARAGKPRRRRRLRRARGQSRARLRRRRLHAVLGATHP